MEHSWHLIVRFFMKDTQKFIDLGALAQDMGLNILPRSREIE